MGTNVFAGSLYVCYEQVWHLWKPEERCGIPWSWSCSWLWAVFPDLWATTWLLGVEHGFASGAALEHWAISLAPVLYVWFFCILVRSFEEIIWKQAFAFWFLKEIVLEIDVIGRVVGFGALWLPCSQLCLSMGHNTWHTVCIRRKRLASIAYASRY